MLNLIVMISGVKKEITFIEDRQQVTFSQFEASQNNALADGKQRNMVTVSLADRFGNVVLVMLSHCLYQQG